MMKATDIHVYRNYISAKGLKNRHVNYLMQEMLTVLKTKHHHDNQKCQVFFLSRTYSSVGPVEF